MHVTHGPLGCGKSCRKCNYLKLGLFGGCSPSRRYLYLAMLWRFSREELKVKLANGKVVRLSHGHELDLRRGASPEEVMKRLLEDKSQEEIRVIGHYHKSLYRPEEGGVMLGAWQAVTPEERRMGLSPDVADILLIRGNGSMELLKGM